MSGARGATKPIPMSDYVTLPPAALDAFAKLQAEVRLTEALLWQAKQDNTL